MFPMSNNVSAVRPEMVDGSVPYMPIPFSVRFLEQAHERVIAITTKPTALVSHRFHHDTYVDKAVGTLRGGEQGERAQPCW